MHIINVKIDRKKEIHSQPKMKKLSIKKKLKSAYKNVNEKVINNVNI